VFLMASGIGRQRQTEGNESHQRNQFSHGDTPRLSRSGHDALRQRGWA
jgi:hypothetical protein